MLRAIQGPPSLTHQPSTAPGHGTADRRSTQREEHRRSPYHRDETKQRNPRNSGDRRNVTQKLPPAEEVAPFVLTGQSPSGLHAAIYHNQLFLFAGTSLLLGDSYVNNIIITTISGREYMRGIYSSPFYNPELRIHALLDRVSELNALPRRVVVSVGCADTRNTNSDLKIMQDEYHGFLRVLYEKGVRILTILPNIEYDKQLPIRRHFNEYLHDAGNIFTKFRRYDYRGEYLVTPGTSKPEAFPDRVAHRPAEN